MKIPTIAAVEDDAGILAVRSVPIGATRAAKVVPSTSPLFCDARVSPEPA